MSKTYKNFGAGSGPSLISRTVSVDVKHHVYLLSEGADRVAGQLRGDTERPVSGVTRSGRVWRKVPESDARSVGRLHAHSSFLHQSSAASSRLAVVSSLQPAFLSLISLGCFGLCLPAATTDGRFVPQCKLSLRLVFAAAVHNLQACDATAAVKWLYTTYRPMTLQLQ